jgi:hypothetical protein
MSKDSMTHEFVSHVALLTNGLGTQKEQAVSRLGSQSKSSTRRLGAGGVSNCRQSAGQSHPLDNTRTGSRGPGAWGCPQCRGTDPWLSGTRQQSHGPTASKKGHNTERE